MTSPSSRFRIALPAQEAAYLHWLAVESGNDEQTEARLLLVMGIRLAMRRYRRLYGGLPLAVADQMTLEANTPREKGDDPVRQWTRLPDHHPIGGYDPDPGEPPLTLPEWSGHPAHNPNRERGFAGHGQEDSE